jgi:hypothetical protein
LNTTGGILTGALTGTSATFTSGAFNSATVGGQNVVVTNDSRLSAGSVLDASVSATAAIAQSKIADLPTSLSSKAPLVSPSFSGTVLLSNSTALGGNSNMQVINNTVDGFSSHYLTTTNAASGSEQGQIYVGQNTGLNLRTNTSHPINIAPNNNEAIRALPSKEVLFRGPVTLDNSFLTVGSGIADTTPSSVQIQPGYISVAEYTQNPAQIDLYSKFIGPSVTSYDCQANIIADSVGLTVGTFNSKKLLLETNNTTAVQINEDQTVSILKALSLPGQHYVFSYISATHPAIVTNVTTAIQFNTLQNSRGSGSTMWDSTNNRFTIPTTGLWRIESSITYQTSTTSIRIVGNINQNGVPRASATAYKVNFPGGVFVSATLLLTAGDNVSITTLHQAGSDMSLRNGSDTYICLTFVG